jgi:hypothetical protein
VEWVVREGVGAGGRNDLSLVCIYELKKKMSNTKEGWWSGSSGGVPT